MKTGKVYITGAGPGDPELLTIKAKRVIESADVIIYDRLIDKDILKYARDNCELVYMGKGSGDGGVQQDAINSTIVSYGLDGKTVVRLKGGDPFMFGRGGEECEALVENGIPFEVIPGVSSAFAVPAYAGIPVTHRDFAGEVHIFTGHNRENRINIDFKKAAVLDGTKIIFMGLGNLSFIKNSLIENGASPMTPAACIYKGTTSEQETVTGALRDIDMIVQRKGLSSPVLFVIGESVRLRGKLGWFERESIPHKKVPRARVLVTGLPDGELAERLELAGFECDGVPFITTAPIDADRPDLSAFDGVLFTGSNGVRYFFERMGKGCNPYGLKVFLSGKSSAAALKEYFDGDYTVFDSFTAERSVSEIRRLHPDMKRILYVTSNLSEFDGGNCGELEVVKIPFYRTEILIRSGDFMDNLFDEQYDFIVFKSGSAVSGFYESCPDKRGAAHSKIISIGTTTGRMLSRYGVEPDYQAEQFNNDGIMAGIIELAIKKNIDGAES